MNHCWKLFWKTIPKTKSKKFRIEKVIKRKGDKLYVKWKGYDSLFKIWIDKKTLNEILSNAVSLYKNKSILSYYPQNFGGNIKVKVDLSNYATKTDIKNVTHVDTSSFVLKKNLAILKTKVDKLDIDKLAPVPVDLSKLNDVKNDVIKKLYMIN